MTQEISELQSQLENYLLNLVADINGSLTQIYKAIHQIQTGVQTLEDRLNKLEQELGEDKGDTIQLDDIYLDQLEVSKPDIKLENHDIEQNLEESDIEDVQEDDKTHLADMDFVRASVSNGKPDKDAVRQWIMAEKEKDPGLSYGHLATMLNDAGIPTLSGRDYWTRGVVRNLAVREKNN